MIDLGNSLHINPAQVTDELIPAIRKWDARLDRYNIDRKLWFIFGSVVDKSSQEQNTEPVHPLLEALGERTTSRSFRPESDIDVGLVVSDGQDVIDLGTYRKNSPFKTASVAGHLLDLTRFEHSWVLRRGTNIEKLREGNHSLSIYGQIVPIEL